LLMLHDAFLPGGALPPPEVVLGSLDGASGGGCRTWPIDRLREALKRWDSGACTPADTRNDAGPGQAKSEYSNIGLSGPFENKNDDTE
jgi:hypothetical protein